MHESNERDDADDDGKDKVGGTPYPWSDRELAEHCRRRQQQRSAYGCEANARGAN
jgi:hypothetical protein